VKAALSFAHNGFSDGIGITLALRCRTLGLLPTFTSTRTGWFEQVDIWFGFHANEVARRSTSEFPKVPVARLIKLIRSRDQEARPSE
jgi:hypothetical protein